ncbi:M23 family metallopeptidase [Ralstonia sp. UBA689]|uniref:M23 family metallopeptidase n=1 Tax=Ralstonia sp. UBA689 TaxID=1947373 RepID=UPI0025F4004E|nr:M23 family metallopeptidase [Ralstonia sp. UBA689]
MKTDSLFRFTLGMRRIAGAALAACMAMAPPPAVAVLSNATHATRHPAATALSADGPWVPDDQGARMAFGDIESNLRDELEAAAVPDHVVAEVERLFGTRADLKAPGLPGDYFRLIYEPIRLHEKAGAGKQIAAAEIVLGGRQMTAVRFAAPGRTTNHYYTFDGQPLLNKRFTTPVKRARLTSPFGMRTHPITGVPHGHSGTDFAAPIGTPVGAAAPGIVRFVGTERGYGKHVVVNHADGYSTLYAHLSAFAPGIRAGAKVARGQKLGAVGKTGMATGPHLHFEVRVDNQPTDPIAELHKPGGHAITATARAAFTRTVEKARAWFAMLPSDTGNA